MEEKVAQESGKVLSKVIKIDENEVKKHLSELVRGTVEETLNSMLDEEADILCGAKRYERSSKRLDTRAGSYKRSLQTKAGEGAEAAKPAIRDADNRTLPPSRELRGGGFGGDVCNAPLFSRVALRYTAQNVRFNVEGGF